MSTTKNTKTLYETSRNIIWGGKMNTTKTTKTLFAIGLGYLSFNDPIHAFVQCWD